jgi:hypothetical protein
VGARVACDELVERSLHGIGERGRESGWERHPETVARDQAVGAGDPHADRAALLGERVDPGRGVAPGARRDLLEGEITDISQEVVQIVGVASLAIGGEALKLELERVEGVGIDELAQLLAAEQVAQ